MNKKNVWSTLKKCYILYEMLNFLISWQTDFSGFFICRYTFVLCINFLCLFNIIVILKTLWSLWQWHYGISLMQQISLILQHHIFLRTLLEKNLWCLMVEKLNYSFSKKMLHSLNGYNCIQICLIAYIISFCSFAHIRC